MSSRDIVLVALFAAIMAVLGLIPPFGASFGVPVTVQSIGPMLAGAIIGARRGALSMLLFLALVAIGAPLLAGGRGGWIFFVDQGAGYRIAFPFAAWAIGLAVGRWANIGTTGLFIVNAVFGLGLVHLFGIVVASWVTGFSLGEVFLGDLVFVPGDVLKAAVAAIVTVQLRRAYPAFAFRS
jgi:biotin transport system substrate-specific component